MIDSTSRVDITEPATRAARVRGDAASERLRILLLEDNPADGQLTLDWLRDCDDGVDCDVAAALSEVSADRLARVQCALIELALPAGIGLQSVETLRELAPDLPIVVLTALDDEDTAAAALRHGAQEYLVKQHADGHAIARAIHLAVIRKRLQPALDQQVMHDLDLQDEVIQQLFAIGLAMRTTQRRSANQPEVAARIADHMYRLQQVVRQLRSAARSWTQNPRLPTQTRLPPS